MNNISIIIPTWNRAEETIRAVESVLRQTYQDFEIIVADDGSTDSTEAVFSNYPDKRVSYVRLEHTGLPAAARNIALRIAKGKWIAFLDSDDTWNQEKLSIQMNYVRQHPDVKLVCSNAFRYLNGKRTGSFFPKNNNIQDTLESLVGYSNFIINSSVIVRKDIIEKIGGLSEETLKRGIEDFDLWAKICLVETFHFINLPLVNYTENQNNSIRSQVAKENYSRGMMEIFEKLLNACINNGKLSPKLESLLIKGIYSYRNMLNDWCQLDGNCQERQQLTPEVSVILPVFNGEKYIRESVFSILNQTLLNLELIVINDGSTDLTQQLLEEIVDPRIIIVNQQNQGIVASLNKGIELARGRFIARQDHDDIAFPTRMEKQVKFLQLNPDFGLVGTWAEIWDENNCTIGSLTPPDSDIVLRERLLFDNPFVHSSMMISKNIFDQGGVYSQRYATSALEDYELWSRLSGYCKIANLPVVLQVYRSVTGSITHLKRENFIFREEVAKKYSGQYISIEKSGRKITQLVALSVFDQKSIDRNLPFSSCRIVYNEIVKNLLQKKGVAFKGSEIEKNSSINDLRSNYYLCKIHLPWRVIIKLDKKWGFPLLNIFEFWEKSAPDVFSLFAKVISAIYEFIFHIYQRIINQIKISKERTV